MGNVLLLLWRRFVGVVLQLSLCTTCFRYVLPPPAAPTNDNPDLKGIDLMQFEFELGTPFKPFEQLMGVLPAASMEQVPEAYRVGVLSLRSPDVLIVP